MGRRWFEGRIESFDIKRGYGFMHHEEYGRVLVHSRSLGHGVDSTMIKPGIFVRFQLDRVRTGFVGRLVTPVEEVSEQLPAEARIDLKSQEALPQLAEKGIRTTASVDDILSRLETPRDYLAAALLCREQKRWNDARRIYQRGIECAPEVHLVLSFAAFEKNQNRPEAVREVYRKGMALFPNHQKLHEDAGVWELKTGNPEQSIKYFERALSLNPPKGSRANLHRWLGSAYFQLSTRQAAQIDKDLLARAKDNLEQANGLTQLSHEEVNLLHRMGAYQISAWVSRSFELFERTGFAIIQVFQPDTHSIDFIVEPVGEELHDTYGLEEAILVRHLLAEPKVMELRNLDTKLEGLVKEERADPGLAFLIVKRSKPLMSALRRRLESGGQDTTIVPIERHTLGRNGADPSDQFRNILDQWLFRRDLYRDNFPVRGSHFFGRERQIKSLFTCVNEGRHVGIFGLRKVGKTSFLWRVRDKSDTDLVAYVDLLAVPAAVKNCNYVFWLLGSELAKDFRRKYPNLAKKTRFGMFGVYDDFEPLLDAPVSLLFDSDLNRLRKAMAHAKIDPLPKIVVLIDEVERLLPAGRVSKGFDGYFDFFSYWRGQAQHYRDVVTVVTGANPAITEQAQWEGIDNPVYKFYEEEFLPPLDFNECATMVCELGLRMGVRYTVEAVRKIYWLTGGHPFIARRLCSRICQRRPARPLTVDDRMVQDAAPDFMQEDSDLFDEILVRLKRDFPEELRVLEFIAKRGEASRKEIRKLVGQRAGTIIHHLIGYQLVDQRYGRYKIGIELLREWVMTG